MCICFRQKGTGGRKNKMCLKIFVSACMKTELLSYALQVHNGILFLIKTLRLKHVIKQTTGRYSKKLNTSVSHYVVHEQSSNRD